MRPLARLLLLLAALALSLPALAQSGPIYVVGDSFADGTGASTPAKAWRALLAAELGRSVTSLAHGGDMVGDQTNEIYSISPGADTTTIIALGPNDQRIYGVSSIKKAYYADGLLNHMAWSALANRQTARSIAGETGAWSNTGIHGIGRATSQIGATKTFTLSGSTLYVSVIIVETAGAGGSYELRVDGNLIGSFSANAPGVTSYNGYPYTERLHRLPGYGAGTHALEVKMTGASYLYVEWAAGNAQTVFPKVLVNNIPQPDGYQWGGSLANIQAYNAEIAQNVADLVSDGLDVSLVDVFSVIDPSTDIHADNLHPNDNGHADIASANLAALGSAGGGHTYQPVDIVERDDGLFFIDNGETLTQLVTQ